MKILVTGANGFVGAALCTTLLKYGHIIRKAIRYTEKAEVVVQDRTFEDSPNSEVAFVASIERGADWSMALHSIDVVIHLAARVHVMHESVDDPLTEFRRINVSGTEHLARSAAANGVKRLVYVSSIKVNGEATCGGEKFTETDVPSPQDPYGISKMEAEQALHRIAQETGLEVVIVRPPLVYGAEVKGNFAQMLKVLAKGIPLPLASVRNLRSLVYVENLVDALIVCTTHPAAAGQTYLVSDSEDISTPGLLRQLGAMMGHPARLLPCPLILLKLAGQLSGKSDQVERLLGSLQIDSGKIRRELNWIPPYSLQQGLQKTAEWYRSSRPTNIARDSRSSARRNSPIAKDL